MPIPFTQYLRPDGRTKEVSIERPSAVEDAARRFLESGGRYEAEVLTTGEVSLTAVKNDEDVAIVVSANGPNIPDSVDELVQLSQSHI